MTAMSSLYILIFPENRVLKIGKANNVYSRSRTLKRHWGQPNYEDSFELTAPQDTVFRLEKSLHFLLTGHQVPFDKGDGRTELFTLDALDLTLKHVELFLAAGAVQATLRKGVCPSDVAPAPRKEVPVKRLLSGAEMARGISSVGVDEMEPVKFRRASHADWARLTGEAPMASALLHILMAKMDKRFTVTASYAALGEFLKCSDATIRRAVAVLKKARWIDVDRVAAGSINSFVVRQSARSFGI